ncbi:MAG TPA: hypothetical protein VHD91_12420 [Gaiellaceae bacterium]|nr:hypothetical protein [Gaiellaceae bacterium]
MHEYLHDLGTKRIHWRYDDPSGLPDSPSRVTGKSAERAAGELRVRARTAQILRVS